MEGSDSDDALEKQYFDLISWGGFMVPSSQMVDFVCACFALLDYADKFIARHNQSTRRDSAEKFWKLILQSIFLLVTNTQKKDLNFQQKMLWIYFTTTNKSLHRMKVENIL